MLLPNPFLNAQGELFRSWEEQRTYLAGLLAAHLYGAMPPAPENVRAVKTKELPLWDGGAVFEVYELSCGPAQSVRETLAVIRPAAGRALPIVLCGGYVEEEIAKHAVSEGFCIVTPLFDEAAPDDPQHPEGTLARAYPEASFKTIAMWGWLLSRVIDWLETADFAVPDAVTVAGHSRNGKAALCCAVYDERVKVCVAAGSGCGGIGSLRTAGSRFGPGTGTVETLGAMVRENFPHWFLDSLAPYGAAEPGAHHREDALPFDADFIGAAIAPRPLLLLEGLDDTWANPYGTLASWSAVSQVYHYLGAEKRCAIHFREGGHELNLADWTVLLAFCRSQLSPDAAPPAPVWRTWQPGDPPIARDWTAPPCETPPPDSAEAARTAALWRDRLFRRWAFDEAGLETRMARYMKEVFSGTAGEQNA